MSVTEIERVIAALDEFKKEMKDDIKDLRREIKEGLDNKCNTCQNAPAFRERIRSQWFHIVALWAAFTTLGGGFLWLSHEYLLHLTTGK